MRQCPACRKWTLDFDEYFGRFRCFDRECGWMPPSATENERRLLGRPEQIMSLGETSVEELGLVVTFSYDCENDTLLLDFGSDEPSIELPEADGGLIWKIGQRSNTVIGFGILAAKKRGVQEVRMEILAARKESIERHLKGFSIGVPRIRPAKVLVEDLVVRVQASKEDPPKSDERIERISNAFREGLERFEHAISSDPGMGGEPVPVV